MIALFTDFGLHGPYTGQMKAVLYDMAPGVPVVDLFADAPVGDPKASAYLLAAYARGFRSEPSFFASSTPASAGRGRRSLSKPTAGFMSAPATACSSSSGAARSRLAASRSTGDQSAFRPVFTGATSSPRSRPCWPAGTSRPAGLRRRSITARTGRTTLPRSFTSITTATP